MHCVLSLFCDGRVVEIFILRLVHLESGIFRVFPCVLWIGHCRGNFQSVGGVVRLLLFVCVVVVRLLRRWWNGCCACVTGLSEQSCWMLDVGWIADLDAVGRHVADGSPVAADTPTVAVGTSAAYRSSVLMLWKGNSSRSQYVNFERR